MMPARAENGPEVYRSDGPVDAVTAAGDEVMSILMVTARFAPFVGGTEIHTGEVATELAARGHRVTVVTTETTGSLARHEQVGGVTVIRVPAYPRWTDLYFAPGIRKIILEGQWDLVHVQGYHTAVAPIALAAAKQADIPTFLTFHSGGHSSSLRNVLRPLHALALRPLLVWCENLIAVSNFEADLFAKRLWIGRERITVIPNGISTSNGDITPDSERSPAADFGTERDPDDSITVLSMGRLVRYKGHHRIIKAMPYLRRSNPKIRLLILGQGPYEGRLRRLAAKLGVEDLVDFDFVPADQRQRMEAIMADASLAVLLSDYESQGMAAYEAISAGLPVVAMDKTALGELVALDWVVAAPPQSTDQEIAAIVNRSLRKQQRELRKQQTELRKQQTELSKQPAELRKQPAELRKQQTELRMAGSRPPAYGWSSIVDRIVELYHRRAARASA